MPETQKLSKKEFFDKIKLVPKAELHIHCEAVITLKTVKKLYEKNFNAKMPEEEEASLFAFSDLNGFIQSFLKVQSYFTDVSDFDLLFSDISDYLEENNIVYCEMFFSPSAFLKKGFSFEKIAESLSRNIEKIEKETGRKLRILFDVSRTFGRENAENNFDLVSSYKNDYFLGIGLGGAEASGPAKDFVRLFERAREKGLHAVAHAGEDVGPESVWDTVKLLKAERIGHGISSIRDPKLMEYLSEHRIPLEICVSSNTFTKKLVSSAEDHPVKAFYEAGIPVTIATDDPTFFFTTLLNEYWILYSKINFSIKEILDLIANGFRLSFLPEKEKNLYLEELEKAVSTAGF